MKTLSHYLKFLPRAGLLAMLAAVGMTQAPKAHADSMLMANTTLVTGTQTAVFSFTAPSDGYVTATLINQPWQKTLKSLSFEATSGTSSLSSWALPDPASDTTTEMQSETFQVSAGNYFAHIAASTWDAASVGVFSLNLSFAPVPLPASSILLLTGIFGLFLVSRNRRSLGF